MVDLLYFQPARPLCLYIQVHFGTAGAAAIYQDVLILIKDQ